MATLAAALKGYDAKHETKAADATEIRLCAQVPPIAKLDSKSLSNLSSCEKLSLSTNAIDRMQSLAGMKALRILSLGRNNIKKVEKLDDVASTLEQLWMSYNQIASLDGLSSLVNLHTLYMSNNKVASFSELDKLASLPKLRDVLFVGNPMYDALADKGEARLRVLKHLPNVTKIDGEMVKPSEIEAAKALAD